MESMCEEIYHIHWRIWGAFFCLWHRGNSHGMASRNDAWIISPNPFASFESNTNYIQLSIHEYGFAKCFSNSRRGHSLSVAGGCIGFIKKWCYTLKNCHQIMKGYDVQMAFLTCPHCLDKQRFPALSICLIRHHTAVTVGSGTPLAARWAWREVPVEQMRMMRIDENTGWIKIQSTHWGETFDTNISLCLGEPPNLINWACVTG